MGALGFSSIERQFKEKIRTFFLDNENFDDKLILDFDINTDGLSPRKKKFLSFDFYLRQNERNKKSLTDLKAVVSRRTSTVSNNLVYLFKENNFQIEKRK